MRRVVDIVRQVGYSLFSFCYFLVLAFYLTVMGIWYLIVLGNTEKNKLRYHKLLQRHTRYVIRHVPGTTFEYVNQAGEDFTKPSVIICNHQSHLDLMGIMMLTSNLIILTKSWVWHNPFYGLVIRFADFLPASGDDEMMEKLKARVANGYSVMVFPERTRSADGRIGRFNRGAFKIAEDLGLDIVPVFISGFGQVLPKTSWHLHKGDMRLEVLPRFGSDNEMWQNGGYRAVAKTLHKSYVTKNDEMRDNR